MRHRRPAGPALAVVAALIVATGSLPAAAGASPVRGPAPAAAPAPAVGTASPVPGGPSWLTAADVADGVPTPGALQAVRAGLPADPVQATDDLVTTVFGPDRRAAIAATGEILRRAGLPLVSALGPVVAMPDGAVVITAPIQVEFLPMLADSVRGGVFYTPDQVGELLQYVVTTPKPFTGAQIVSVLDQWGKGAGDPGESVVGPSPSRGPRTWPRRRPPSPSGPGSPAGADRSAGAEVPSGRALPRRPHDAAPVTRRRRPCP